MIKEKVLHLQGIEYDELIEILYKHDYIDRSSPPIRHIYRTPDFHLKYNVGSDFKVTDRLTLIIYNPKMLNDDRIKYILFEYLI